MTFNDFKNLVRQMREAQKQYFRTRDPAVLSRSKELERRIDAALETPDPQRGFGFDHAQHR